MVGFVRLCRLSCTVHCYVETLLEKQQLQMTGMEIPTISMRDCRIAGYNVRSIDH